LYGLFKIAARFDIVHGISHLQTMYIDSIVFQNFRSFNCNTKIKKLKKINVFIGQNGSGKTNVIHALYSLKALEYKEWDNTVVRETVFDFQPDTEFSISVLLRTSEEDRREILKRFIDSNPSLTWLNQDENFLSKIRYTIKVDGEKIVEEILALSIKTGRLSEILVRKIEEGVPKQRSVGLTNVLSKINSVSELKNMKLEIEINQWTPNLLILDSLTDKFESEVARQIKSFFGKFHWYIADRRIPDEFTSGENSSLVGDGRNIKAHIRYLHNNDFTCWTKFKQVVDEFMGISDIRINQSNEDVLVKKAGLKSEFDLSKLSAGEKQLLILLDSMVIQKVDNVYLVEEPEAHVHSSTQRKLLQSMFKSSDKSQFFVTTHSPIFLNMSEEISNYLVKKINGKSRIERVESRAQIQKIKRDMGIDNLDALKSNFVLFVEGMSEVRALRIMGEIAEYSALRFIPIIPYKGTGNFKGLMRFINWANDLELVPLVIADGHPDMKSLKTARIPFTPKHTAGRKGRRRKIRYILRKDGQEFEDQFENRLIVDAMKKVNNNIQCKFNELESMLITGKENKKNVSTILREFLGSKCTQEKSIKNQELSKTALAEALSKIVVSEIIKNPTRGKTNFEKNEVDRIFRWIK
jgi:predicted ATPase